MNLIEKLNLEHKLSKEEWISLIKNPEAETAKSFARKIQQEKFGNSVFFRGIIEISNICKNNCFYCGIRKNCNIERYSMSDDEIFSCAKAGYLSGFRTFVLQGGENGVFTVERLLGIVSQLKKNYPDCAVTLSVGELKREEYQSLFDAGADRYLLRHETADKEHYRMLHPKEMSFENRMECLYNIKDIGYQTGCGMMVGTPYQRAEHLASDMVFMQNFKPHMIGLGPFIPAKGTPFENFDGGSVELSLYLLSLCRIMLPDVLLPSTTALGSARKDGRIKGIEWGANVIMPNLSPKENREKYMLYNNKAVSDSKEQIEKALKIAGYNLVSHKGDRKIYD